jgi:oligopeptidase A
MLTNVDSGFVSGINGVEWDAVELPSQFMENWCTHWPTLQGLTNNSLSAADFETLKKLKQFRAGSIMMVRWPSQKLL